MIALRHIFVMGYARTIMEGNLSFFSQLFSHALHNLNSYNYYAIQLEKRATKRRTQHIIDPSLFKTGGCIIHTVE